jgi:hypothetical protein
VEHQWNVFRDLARGEAVLEVIKDNGRLSIPEINLEYEKYAAERYSVTDDDRETLSGETRGRIALRRDDWQVATETRTHLSATPEDFIIHADLDAYEGEHRIFSRSWERRIPRDLV